MIFKLDTKRGLENGRVEIVKDEDVLLFIS